MSKHTVISAEEAADRLAIRELIDAYARCADRRLPEEQADLYAEGARTLVYMGQTPDPVQVLTSREQHVEGFSGLSQYAATTHLNGQFTIDLDGDRATGEGYCLAHHILENEQGRSLMVMSIRYEDAYTKQNGVWLFAERKLIVTWTDTRPSRP
jgi:SnoaL-like domain